MPDDALTRLVRRRGGDREIRLIEAETRTGFEAMMCRYLNALVAPAAELLEIDLDRLRTSIIGLPVPDQEGPTAS